MAFHHGQRVRTTNITPAGWDGALSVPAGATGTIANGPDRSGTYGVLLDCDPDQMPASYWPDELTPA